MTPGGGRIGRTSGEPSKYKMGGWGEGPSPGYVMEIGQGEGGGGVWQAPIRARFLKGLIGALFLSKVHKIGKERCGAARGQKKQTTGTPGR